MIYRLALTTALAGSIVGCIGWVSAAEPSSKSVRVGIIGLDTSHVISFTRIFNDPQETGELANFKIVVGYPGGTDFPPSATRVDKFTEQLRGMGLEIVDSIPELLKKADVVLLESVDGRPHLEQVLPVFKAGKPVFIDKPLAGSLKDAITIFEAARLYDVPVFSSSSARFYDGLQKIRNGEIGEVLGCDTFGPCSIQPTHPDLFWYGVHGVESLFTCMSTGCETVTRVTTDDFDVVVGKWNDGRIGTYRGIRKGKSSFGGTAFGSKAVLPFERSGGHHPLLIEIAKFFRSGEAPVRPEETLEIFAFMEAADESKRLGGVPVSIQEILKKASVATTWKGEWDGGGGQEHCGELRCLARQQAGDNWEAIFTGYCNRKFAYEVTMKGKRRGDSIAFAGDANLGPDDGGTYHWTGEITAGKFVGRYTSEKGQSGTFKMQRLNTDSEDQ